MPATTSTPATGSLKIELHDGQLVIIYNGIEATLDHWHFEVFNAPKADNDPALVDINWKLQFQTNVKGYVDAVAVPAGAEYQADRLHPAARQEALRPRVPQAIRRANTSWPGGP